MAEFVIAIVPVLTTFFSFVQLSRIASARLVLKHSAIVGARAAAVMSNGNNTAPDQPSGDQKGEITKAVKSAMGPWFTKAGAFTTVNVTVTDQSNKDDPYNWVEVKVETLYACNVPMGFIACGGNTKRLEETYKMPHQGANYKMK